MNSIKKRTANLEKYLEKCFQTSFRFLERKNTFWETVAFMLRENLAAFKQSPPQSHCTTLYSTVLDPLQRKQDMYKQPSHDTLSQFTT